MEAKPALYPAAHSRKIPLQYQPDSTCPVLQAKRLWFRPDPNHFTYYRRPVSHEGRLAIVTDARRDAVDADVLLTSGTEADGEVVWS
jgi:hypothetical protein